MGFNRRRDYAQPLRRSSGEPKSAVNPNPGNAKVQKMVQKRCSFFGELIGWRRAGLDMTLKEPERAGEAAGSILALGSEG
jgi:hypothetical protein